jgi:hypothetical protein
MMALLASRLRNAKRRHQPERVIMKKFAASLFIVGTVCVGAVVTGASPAQAEVEYAWCAIGQNQGAQSCSFSTAEQCRSFLSGTGFCQMNPRASTRAEMPRRAR